jgi:hypothetical protein
MVATYDGTVDSSLIKKLSTSYARMDYSPWTLPPTVPAGRVVIDLSSDEEEDIGVAAPTTRPALALCVSATTQSPCNYEGTSSPLLLNHTLHTLPPATITIGLQI